MPTRRPGRPAKIRPEIRIPDSIAHTDAERGENNHHSLIKLTLIQHQTPHIQLARIRKEEKEKDSEEMGILNRSPKIQIMQFPSIYIYLFGWFSFHRKQRVVIFFFVFFFCVEKLIGKQRG